MRLLCPSGWLPPHRDRDGGVGYITEYGISNLKAIGDRTRKINPEICTSLKSFEVSPETKNIFTIGYLSSLPPVVTVHGYNIKLESGASYENSVMVELPAEPSTGTRQDLVILEVWKEKVIPGVSDDCFFPYGNVGYDPKGYESSVDGCSLSSTTRTGGNWPLYLAGTYGNPCTDSSYHGKYVTANDSDIKDFIKNPVNNVGVSEDGNYFQIRWRLATLKSAHATNMKDSYLVNDDLSFKPQGMLASRPANGSSTGSDGAFVVKRLLDNYAEKGLEYSDQGEILNPEMMVTDQIVCDYRYRHANPYDFYEDCYKTMVFYGTLAFPERDKPGIITWFVNKSLGHWIQGKPRALKSARQKNKYEPGAKASQEVISQYVDSSFSSRVN